MTDRQVLRRLPEELKNLSQWCIAGPDKAPYLAGQTGLYRASVTGDSFMLFEDALRVASQLPPDHGIGFVLRATDPFTCVDYDVKTEQNEPDPNKHTPPQHIQWIQWMVEQVGSYTERSRSGIGLHTFVRENIGQGCRRGGVEVYSQERFIICTGDVYLDAPIVESEYVTALVEAIRSDGSIEKLELEEVEQTESDEVIWERASEADNKDKFTGLCNGYWQQYGYPSQSEADLSLMSMFTFYSDSNEQCRRLFRKTVLGQRDKATKNDRYLNYTLSRIRARQAHEKAVLEKSVEQSAIFRQEVEKVGNLAEFNIAAAEPVTTVEEPVSSVKPSPDDVAALIAAMQQGDAGAAESAQAAINTVAMPEEDGGLEWPPGLVGTIAAFIYNSSIRPVKEVSIVSGLGLMAGMAGKAFTIPQSGLNIYLILIARSGIGKEAMHSGLGHILYELRDSSPFIHNYVDFSDFASGQALVKACASNPCFVNVAGEWGRKLQRMSTENRVDGPMQHLRTVMTNLYQKSGPNSVVGGLMYSNQEQNITSVNGVAYSMIGETTPGTFYDSLTEQMMEDGFLSRFTMVEYNGIRPPQNQNPITTLSPELKFMIEQIAIQAQSLLSKFETQMVGIEPEARQVLHHFNEECDYNINRTDNESWRQMWNRAHLKVMRIAALLAVGDNYIQPRITINHLNWALEFIRRDIRIMERRVTSGDIGTTDHARTRKLADIIFTYFKKPIAKSYKVPEGMRENNIVPYNYLSIRTGNISAFTKSPYGARRALTEAIDEMKSAGFLIEVDPIKSMELYGYHGRCFRVVDLPAFNVEE